MSIHRRGYTIDEKGNEVGGGDYYYRFSYKGHSYCEGGFPNMGQAKEGERLKRNLIIVQGQRPDDYAGDMTFRQAGEWWLREYAPHKRSKKIDFSRMPLAMDYFDRKLLREIRPEHVQNFLERLSELRGEPISDHTRNHYLALIRALYSRLIHLRKYKGENPATFVDRIKVPTARVRFIYPAEEKILTPAVRAESDIFAFYYMGLNTGMRMGEMLSTKVEHVDLSMRHIFIPHPKNNRSRYVPYDEPLEAFFKHYMAGKDSGAYLLPHWGHAYVLAHFKAICKGVGIKNLKPHDWRHTFAYNCLSKGEPIYNVSKIMGHSSSSVTERHYGHLAAKDLRDTVERISPFLPCNSFATEDIKASESIAHILPRNG